jgi:hypothetical protein
MEANKTDLKFDYEGALRLARQLYGLAGAVGQAATKRQGLADTARKDFIGEYANQFGSRMTVEQANFQSVARGLRDDAMAVATMWKQAMDEENRRLYARHVDDVKSHRSVLESIGDWFTGFHYPPAPAAVALPQPPSFAPTATLVHY